MKMHPHFEIDYLLGRSDCQLAEIITSPTDMQQARRELGELQDKGQQYLVVGDCDNTNPDGSCAGHPSTAEEV
ncbi:hypothetical protein [Halomonas organivorans]|uniref:Uncharacterized protein n=1 Tax=Halomonas organivorans TaxID=257772 RepID=A0A7W5C130_9GAMM|nr:hypothetical protein [Halomonas organivorans]MBB3142785.1 hypothetical protein [Halomonas organivorans]